MRIAVIGGGVSGLVTTWLLEQTHDVMLFERAVQLGGHAHTVAVEHGGRVHAVDAGIHLFHPRQFARFSRLLAHLGVPTRQGMVRITFEDGARGEHLILPPVRTRFPQIPIGWFGRLGKHLLLARALRHGRRLVDDWETEVTLDQLPARAGLPESFVHDFLAPATAAMWGVASPTEMLEFSAVVPLWYMTRLGWRAAEIVGGTRAYLDQLAKDLGRATVRRATPVDTLRRRGARWSVHGETFDAVVLATNAGDAASLIAEAAPRAAEVLRGFRYYRTTVAVHRDVERMPGRRAWWSYCNVRYDGTRSRATLWKGEWDDRPLFTTWIHGDERPPAELVELVRFEHPRMTPLHFRQQKLLEALQGDGGLHFAGVYTGGVDSHESGVASAVRVTERIDSGAPRLAVVGA